VYLEECGEPIPHSAKSGGIGAVDLFEDREEPPLLLVVIEDQLGDVHGSPIGMVSGMITGLGDRGLSPRGEYLQHRGAQRHPCRKLTGDPR
jgi:hypothetical protein